MAASRRADLDSGVRPQTHVLVDASSEAISSALGCIRRTHEGRRPDAASDCGVNRRIIGALEPQWSTSTLTIARMRHPTQ